MLGKSLSLRIYSRGLLNTSEIPVECAWWVCFLRWSHRKTRMDLTENPMCPSTCSWFHIILNFQALWNKGLMGPYPSSPQFHTHIHWTVEIDRYSLRSPSTHLPSESGGTLENSRNTFNHLNLVGAINLWGIDTNAGNYSKCSCGSTLPKRCLFSGLGLVSNPRLLTF